MEYQNTGIPLKKAYTVEGWKATYQHSKFKKVILNLHILKISTMYIYIYIYSYSTQKIKHYYNIYLLTCYHYKVSVSFDYNIFK